jgi:hypothetical protein
VAGSVAVSGTCQKPGHGNRRRAAAAAVLIVPKHRKWSGDQLARSGGSGLVIAVGTLVDGIPESIVIGLILLSGGVVSAVAVAGIFLPNIPEGLSSATGMRKAGWSAKRRR